MDGVGEIPGIVAWIRSRVVEAGAKGCVVGLSGGIDSSVVGALCKLAFPETTLGLIMPFDDADDPFTARARSLAEELGIPVYEHLIGEAHRSLVGASFLVGVPSLDPQLPFGNLRSRLRMCVLYLYGNAMNYLVVGTGNKDEDFGIGYFTKYGDGGVDISPIADFHKSEVYGLAEDLDVPQSILDAPPSAGLWPGQTDEGELGMTYAEIKDASQFLDGLVSSARLTSRQVEVMARVARLRRQNRHKMEPPPVYRRTP